MHSPLIDTNVLLESMSSCTIVRMRFFIAVVVLVSRNQLRRVSLFWLLLRVLVSIVAVECGARHFVIVCVCSVCRLCFQRFLSRVDIEVHPHRPLSSYSSQSEWVIRKLKCGNCPVCLRTKSASTAHRRLVCTRILARAFRRCRLGLDSQLLLF